MTRTSRFRTALDQLLQEEFGAIAEFSKEIDVDEDLVQQRSSELTAKMDKSSQEEWKPIADEGARAIVALEKASNISRVTGDVIRRGGWFPHHTMPLDVLAGCAIENDTGRCRDSLLSFYKENWRDIRQGFDERLSDYSIDEEAKATFHEALDAHENGLYRCVCRVLFTEIERIARVEFFDGKVGDLNGRHLIKKLVENPALSVSDLPAGLHGLIGWGRMTGHLYKNIRDENDRTPLLDDSVPNRHAAIHGLVIYSSEQSSLNSIFMGEYIIQLISLRAAHRRIEK